MTTARLLSPSRCLTACVLFGLCALTGCDASGQQGRQPVSGAWAGPASTRGVYVTLTLRDEAAGQERSSQALAGYGTMRICHAQIPFTVDGTFAAPDLSMVLSQKREQPGANEQMDFEGRVSADGQVMAGTLNTESFGEVSLQLVKQSEQPTDGEPRGLSTERLSGMCE